MTKMKGSKQTVHVDDLTAVHSFRQGSIIVDFEVQTTELINNEIAVANNQLPAAMSPVVPLLSNVLHFTKASSISYNNNV